MFLQKVTALKAFLYLELIRCRRSFQSITDVHYHPVKVGLVCNDFFWGSVRKQITPLLKRYMEAQHQLNKIIELTLFNGNAKRLPGRVNG
jgi:hypothetical protein